MIPIRFTSDTITRSGHMRTYTPSSAASDPQTYQFDVEFFLKNRKRSMFIREAFPGEFENGHDAAFKLNLFTVYNELPTLWVLVFGNETLHFSTPVYRGKEFFAVKSIRMTLFADTLSDETTRLLLAEMDSRGGCDDEKYEAWKKKWLEAVADYQQKALNPTERPN